MRRGVAVVLGLSTLLAFAPRPAGACTNLIITKGASADGSTFITYAADSHELYGELYLQPGGVFPAGAMRDVVEWDTGKFLGRIPQAPVTYWRVGNINEHQVSIGETTFGGREELAKPETKAVIDYGLPDVHRHRAGEDRARGDQGHDRPRHRVRLRFRGRVVLGRRPERGVDPRDDRQGRGRARRALGRAPHPRRLHLGPRQPVAHPPFPAATTRPPACTPRTSSRSPARRGGSPARTRSSRSPTPTRRLDFGSLRFCEARVWSMFRRAAPSANLSIDVREGRAGAAAAVDQARQEAQPSPTRWR